MLKEIDQNMAMDTSTSSPGGTATRSRLAIHQTNIFKPHKLGVTCMGSSPEKLFLAARRGYLNPKDINGPFSQLDFYNIASKSQPKFVHSMIEYEDITGLSWLDEKHLISVSMQATINIYNIKSGTKVRVMTTDYGPITCMRHSVKDNLLVTGTEYGYAAVYKINPMDRSIVCVDKMVKVTNMIATIDFHMRSRQAPVKTVMVTKKPSEQLKHAKRKRSDSSDESEDEDNIDDNQDRSEGKFLESNDLIIYGGYLDKVVAWNFHRTTIVDTLSVGNEVCSLLVLKSGNIAVADTAGYLGIIDNNTFTCRQSDQIFESSILTLAANSKNSSIVAAGHEPAIAILKIDKSSETKDVYILREKLKDHSAPICCSLFTNRKEFFTASDDNKIIKFRLSKSDGALTLKRFNMMPLYRSKMHFYHHEAMAIFGKSFQIFKFSDDAHMVPEDISRQSLTEPQRICTIRASAYVHAATFDDKWMCYAISAGVKILDRPSLSRVDATDPKLPGCHIMKLCQSGNRRFLVIGQQKRLSVIELQDGTASIEGQSLEKVSLQTTNGVTDAASEAIEKSITRVHKSIYASKLKGVIRDILYYESSNRLVVSCGTSSQSMYIIKLPSSSTESDNHTTNDKKDGVEILFKTGLQSSISHIMRNIYNANDSNLYIYTTKDQLIKCDTSSKTLRKDLVGKLFQQERIRGLPKDIGIQGMVALTSSQCLIYDNIYIFKVDLETNEIVNSSQDYANILTLDNLIFNKPHEILIVSLT